MLPCDEAAAHTGKECAADFTTIYSIPKQPPQSATYSIPKQPPPFEAYSIPEQPPQSDLFDLLF
jgi:hypothetical protein